MLLHVIMSKPAKRSRQPKRITVVMGVTVGRGQGARKGHACNFLESCPSCQASAGNRVYSICSVFGVSPVGIDPAAVSIGNFVCPELPIGPEPIPKTTLRT